VWGLNKCKVELLDKELNEKSGANLRFKLVDPIDEDNPRLVNQNALFTDNMDYADIQKWCDEKIPDDYKGRIPVSIKKRGS
jgi:hypothetical protein